MKKLLSWVMALALLLGTSSIVRSQEQPAGTMQPVLVVSLSGYDEIRNDLDWIGKLGSSPLAEMVDMGLKLQLGVQDFTGLDKSRPWGLVIQTDGQDFSGWKVPQGDGGHWKVLDGVIDYDALSEAAGDKSLWTQQEFVDFVLRVDWRIKETPYINPNVPYILPDGTHARDIHGKEMRMSLPDSDSGIMLRGAGKSRSTWCGPPLGRDVRLSHGRQAAPRSCGSHTRTRRTTGGGGTVRDHREGRPRDRRAQRQDRHRERQMPGVPPRPYRSAASGSMRNGQWTSPPSLLQFRNILIRPL